MADDSTVKSSERVWGDEVKLADPEIERKPEVEYVFSGGRQFMRDIGVR
jgi:hypothetical protein